MVEEEHGQHSSTMARLELLSNTALMRKIMDKQQDLEASRKRSEEVTRNKEDTEKDVRTVDCATIRSTPRCTRSSDSPTTGRVASPENVEPSRDPPPFTPESRGHPSPIAVSGYSPGIDPHRKPDSHIHSTPYPEGSFPRYIHGSHSDLCFLDNSKVVSVAAAAAAAAVHMQHAQQAAGRHHLYRVKENLPPTLYCPAFRHPSVCPPRMYHPSARASPPDHIPHNDDPRDMHQQSYDALVRENHHMRQQLKEKDEVVASLQQRVDYLENQITELRQLPTGKISHIPIDDMIRIMQEYGSEVSNQTLPKRKTDIKKASIVRQFRRWNPEFFRYFIHVNGEWVPKLGKEGELKRRVEKRRNLKSSQGKGY